jgi:tRNA (guanine37-N1)-methyltransferase
MKKNLKYYLEGILTAKELAVMPTTFDVVGDIMIFAGFPDELKKKEKQIAEAVLKNYKHVKVVAKKTKRYSGTFRTPKLKIMGGEDRKETVHKENGVVLHLDVEKVYFSPRLGTERQRILKLVEPKESVLVMFSGCGPYVVEIAKLTGAKKVYGIEINPIAHHYAKINADANKVSEKVKVYRGDAAKIVPRLHKFDRIIMPLPKTADEFLPVAIKAIKKGGVLHFYDFQEKSEFNKTIEKVLSACNQVAKKCTIIKVVQCGQYSPGHYRVCADALVY